MSLATESTWRTRVAQKRRSPQTLGRGAGAMRTRSAYVVLVLASVLIFRSDTFIEMRSDLPSIVSPPLSRADPSFDEHRSEVFDLPIMVSLPISVDDPSYQQRNPGAVAEAKV